MCWRLFTGWSLVRIPPGEPNKIKYLVTILTILDAERAPATLGARGKGHRSGGLVRAGGGERQLLTGKPTRRSHAR